MHLITVQNVIKGPRKEWHCQECWFERLRDATEKATKADNDPVITKQLQSAYQGAKKRRAQRASPSAWW